MSTVTARDLITNAGRRANILAAEEAFNASDMVDALTLLNQMLAGFNTMGIQYVHVDLALTDVVNVPDEQLRNVTLMFCDELADDYGVALSERFMDQIYKAKLALQAGFLVVNPAVPDRALRNRLYGWWTGQSGTG